MGVAVQAYAESFSHEWMCPSLRYEGVDWRDPSKWDCGGNRGDPFAETAGGSLSLDEALFVKIKEGTIQTSSSLAQMAAKYERWMEEQVHTLPSSGVMEMFYMCGGIVRLCIRGLSRGLLRHLHPKLHVELSQATAWSLLEVAPWLVGSRAWRSGDIWIVAIVCCTALCSMQVALGTSLLSGLLCQASHTGSPVVQES